MRLRSRLQRVIARAVLNAPRPLLRRLVGAPRRSPEGFELDLQGQALLWLMRVAREPELHAAGLERARLTLDRSGPLLGIDGVKDVSTFDRMVPGAEGPRRMRVYTPVGARGGEQPGLVWFHGGGFIIGSIESHDDVCRGLASQAGVIVASIDYRLGPEHRFPAGVDDAIAVTRWILENARSLGIDAARVAIGGDSAGGNFAALTAIALRGSPRAPAFQLLVYPATDLTRSHPSHRLFRDGVMLPEATIDWFRKNYLPDPRLESDPRASPFFVTNLSGLPPALVITAGFDPLRDEGHAYAERMRDANVPVEYVCSEGSMHGFINMAGALRESARMLALAADRLKRALSRPAAASAA